jgi:hypothetical protein
MSLFQRERPVLDQNTKAKKYHTDSFGLILRAQWVGKQEVGLYTSEEDGVNGDPVGDEGRANQLKISEVSSARCCHRPGGGINWDVY